MERTRWGSLRGQLGGDTREMLEKRPETVKRFLSALLQGWQDARTPNEASACQVLLDAHRETPEAVVRRQIPVTRRLMTTSRLPNSARSTRRLEADRGDHADSGVDPGPVAGRSPDWLPGKTK